MRDLSVFQNLNGFVHADDETFWPKFLQGPKQSTGTDISNKENFKAKRKFELSCRRTGNEPGLGKFSALTEKNFNNGNRTNSKRMTEQEISMRAVKVLLAAVFFLCLQLALPAQDVKPVKYVFLFIGDGFSIPQRMMAEEYQKTQGKPGLLLNSFPNQVLTTTRCSDSFITDSAASGTAIACGEKTKTGTIGMDVTGTRRLVSTAEVARDSGKKVGIITTVTLNHATPAAFYGHNVNRGNYYDLGLDLIASKFDYFGGGAIDKHNDVKNRNYKGDIYELAKKAGYKVIHDPEEFDKLAPADGKVIACQMEEALPYMIDSTDFVHLDQLVKKGIEMLDNPNGFFMMTEGGKIDWMCHANDAAATLHEIIAFDNAIKVAFDFAQKHKDDTLIVVTGDHETGGLTLGFAGTGYKSYIERLKYQTCSHEGFSKKLAAFAKEKETELAFSDVKPLLTECFGFQFTLGSKDPMDLTENEVQTLKNAFEKTQKNVQGKFSPQHLSMAAVLVLNNKSGLAWTSHAHTALPVNTSALGKNASVFTGLIDNTDISKKLKELVK